jgi:hypothetical protein
MAVNYKNYLDLTHDQDYIDLYKYYSKETIFDIVGVSRQENPHSSFIRWMLGSGDSCGLGDMPIRKFIETAILVKEKYYDSQDANDGRWGDSANIFNPNNYMARRNIGFLEALKYGRYLITSLDIGNEIGLDKARRADIIAVVSIKLQETSDVFHLLILIENKVHSQEHDLQTKSYVEDLKFDKKSFANAMSNLMEERGTEVGESNCLKLFVYLNPANNKDIKEAIKNQDKVKKNGLLPSSKDYLSLTYQNLLDGVIEPLYKLANDEAGVRLLEYIRCLGQARTSCIEDSKGNIKDDGDYLVMAISKEEKSKAAALFHKYSDLILEIISGVGTNEFLLGKSELAFWNSLANSYRLMIKYLKDMDDSQEWQEKVDLLKQNVESSNKGKKQYRFNGCEYESRPTKGSGKKNVGMLCRDIIAVYANDSGADAYDALIKLRDAIQEEISLNWLREGILFSEDIEKLGSNPDFWANGDKDIYAIEPPNGSKRKHRYITTCFEGFENSFFSLWEKDRDNQKKTGNRYDISLDEASNRGNCPYDLEIRLAGTKAYVAKYWTDYELWKLVDIIKNLSGREYRIEC